jgi:hypothetical protein
MKRLATIRGGVAIALMLGIVVAVASSADASPSGQLGAYMREGLSLERAQVALATQSQVEAVELPVRLEKALGASFAGMWFEPSTGKFCIGVVSSASRRAAERVVAQTGLAGVVRYVSVRSTWTQLISAQGEWGLKLAHLAGHQFSTGLTASHNAVSVTLSSSVPEHERALLEREAAGSHVSVSIAVVPPEALVARPLNSQCEFKRAEAYCSKPITAGVLITPLNTAKPTHYCTAGPLAILSNPVTLAAELETFLITAGHCLQEAVKWFTSTHPGKETKEIGSRVQFENGLSGDYGDIVVGPNWLEAGLTPALAQITNYQDNGLREARSVIGEEASMEKASFCKQGATSAEQCGTITGLNQLEVFQAPPDVLTHVAGLVKTNACGEGGDSGGPFATLPTGNSVRILGTLVGGVPQACSGLFCPVGECRIYYEPIKTSLTGLGLTLLTTTNQTRHKPATFEGTFPLHFVALQLGTSTLETVGGNTVSCTHGKVLGFFNSVKDLLVGGSGITFLGCAGTGFGVGKCQTGATEGEITTSQLLGLLGYISNPNVGVLFEPDNAPDFATFKCNTVLGAETLLIRGTVICPLSPVNTTTDNYHLVCNQTKGVQNPLSFEGAGTKDTFETEGKGPTNFAFEQSGIQALFDVLTLGLAKINV